MGKSAAKTYRKIYKDNSASVERLRNRLKVKHLETKKALSDKHPHVDEYLKKKGLEIGKIRGHSAKIIGAGALTGTLLLSPPTGAKAISSPVKAIKRAHAVARVQGAQATQEVLVSSLNEVLPEVPRPLNREEEKHLESLFENIMGVKSKASLEGEHLNTTYGYIGAEQHLKRYPGDTLAQHGEGIMLKEGMAPGLGAWGYFAQSRLKLTGRLEETEKWYAVVQTLYLPDWNTRQPYLRDWYKYRKVLIVNTDNGNAVVAAIADSGPAAWTGKHYGGGPEVMHYLGGDRYKKGPVVLFFVDDPKNKVPLGPVEYNKLNIPEVSLKKI